MIQVFIFKIIMLMGLSVITEWPSVDKPNSIDQLSVIIANCDTIELNHFYDGEGKLLFNQFVFWEFDESDSQWKVVDWMLGTYNFGSTKVNYDLNTTVKTLVINRQTNLFKIKYKNRFFESWTQYDSELANRSILSIEKRRGLFGRANSSEPVFGGFDPVMP